MSAFTQPQLTPERIMRFAWAYSAPLLIEAAVHHKVFDVLAAGPLALAEVSEQTGASVRGLRAVMDALVGLELLAKLADGRYTLVPESEAFLVSTRPGFQGGLFRHMSRQLIPKWLDLVEFVRTGKPNSAINQQASGVGFFEQFVADLFPNELSGRMRTGGRDRSRQ